MTYETHDLGLAAYLKTKDIPLQRNYRVNHKRAIFVFSVDGDINRLVQGYFNNEETVKARDYFENLRNLKAMAIATVERY